MKWFKHDSNASIDAKLQRVRLKYKMEGYGLYWYCLELIARGVEKHNLTFELEQDAELIAMETGIHQQRVEEMMRDFVSWGLFENTSGTITCLKMATRTDEYTQKLINKSSIVPTMSRPDRDKVRSNRIEENRIETNKGKTKRFTPPTFQEVSRYCQERRNSVNPQNFLDHYEAKGWMIGKNKMKDWKAAVRTWEKGAATPKSTFAEGAI